MLSCPLSFTIGEKLINNEKKKKKNPSTATVLVALFPVYNYGSKSLDDGRPSIVDHRIHLVADVQLWL